jgi:hypothetical protein
MDQPNDYWRYLPSANITHREVEKQSRYAERLHEEYGLGPVSQRTYFSRWHPWEECGAAEFERAGIGSTLKDKPC